jgi:hypothetical protein
MNRRVLVIVAALFAVFAGLLALALTLGDRRLTAPMRRTAVAPPLAKSTPGTAHITATLFYGSDDGQSLVPVRTEVPLADSVVAQGAEILKAQLGAPPAPYVSVIPRGTVLRAFYITERGDAFVDLSPEVSTAHPGGSLTELLTVYSLVNAVAANLPVVQRVQLLVGGKEVDTIAGHVDVRRPLTRDMSLVRGEPAR